MPTDRARKPQAASGVSPSQVPPQSRPEPAARHIPHTGRPPTPDDDRFPDPPGAEEHALIAAMKARRAVQPRVTVTRDGDRQRITPDHIDPEIGTARLMRALGTDDPDFLAGLLGQLARASSGTGEIDAGALDFMVSAVRGARPGDQVEAMIAGQMAAVHIAFMRFSRRLAEAATAGELEAAERALGRLGRTFAGQVEALKRHRAKGNQTVTVEHVTVNRGGQAIVGHLEAGGRHQAQRGDADGG